MSDRNREIVRQRAAGKTYDAIAAKLGLTRNTVAGVCARAGRIGNRTGRQDSDGTLGISRAIGFDGGSVGGTGCRFPLWDHVEPPTGKFCGKRVAEPGKPYCKTHWARTHQPYLAKLTAPSESGAPKPGVGLRAGAQE